MAGLDADTSSYPKPTLPTSPLDTAAKLGGLAQQSQQFQRGAIDIDQAKLKLYNDHFHIMNNELSTLANDPAITKEKVLGRLNSLADAFNMPPQVRQKMVDEFAPLQSKDDLLKHLDYTISRGQGINERVNSLYGKSGFVSDGQNVTPSREYLRGGPVPSGDPIAQQLPPSTEVLGENNERRLIGSRPSQIPVGATPTPGGFPGQFRPGFAPPLPAGALNPSGVPGMRPGETPISAQVMPTGPATGLPPGEATLMEAGASHLAKDRIREADFQAEIYPLAQALPALETLGTKGTGPGTETINQLKSFILSNVPGIKADDFDGTVKDFDLAKKYLTQFVTTNGSTGTNDKLAAAFAGNPSVGISNAAAKDVAKSAIALRRMQNAINQEFEAQNLPASQYSKWKAQAIQKTDPRAFGTDLMSDEVKKKLYDQLKKNPTEAKRFEDSLNLAVNMGFLTPSK